MNKIREILMITIALVVLLAFGGGVYAAAHYTLWATGAPRPGDMPAIVSYFVSAVNGTLAANLGAVLGIIVLVTGWRGPQSRTELLQWIAASWYILMLIAASWFWGLTGFTEDNTKVASVLPELSKNGIGISIAVLAAVLGVRTALGGSKLVNQS